jgi:hypothetical protein
MTLYKDRPLIPDRQEGSADLPSAGGPDQAAPLAHTAGTVAASPAPKPDQSETATPDALWQNSVWAVTDFGIEPRTMMANGLPLPCEIAASRLLQIRDGMPGVSNWALHVASKSWCANPDEFLEALAEALRIHHHGQATVDLAATALEARRVWARQHPGRPAKPAEPEAFPPELPDVHREAVEDDEDEFEPEGDDIGD